MVTPSGRIPGTPNERPGIALRNPLASKVSDVPGHLVEDLFDASCKHMRPAFRQLNTHMDDGDRMRAVAIAVVEIRQV